MTRRASTGDACPQCAQVHPKCGAHNRKGAPCGRNRMPNQDVCDLHGGKSPQARVGAARRALEEQARKDLAKLWEQHGETPVTDPLAELARVAGEVVAFKDMLRAQVDSLQGIITYWTERTYDDGDEIHTAAVENVRAVVAAYERAQERAAKILGNMVKLDIAGRMLELRTHQADEIVTAVRDGLASVDLEAAVRSAALEAIADRLAQITEHHPTPKELTA